MISIFFQSSLSIIIQFGNRRISYGYSTVSNKCKKKNRLLYKVNGILSTHFEAGHKFTRFFPQGWLRENYIMFTVGLKINILKNVTQLS